MKVLLINPPSKNELLSCNPDFINEERGYTPPLGLLYIAGYLEKSPDFEISILDCQVEEISYQKLPAAIREKKPDVIGITAMTFTLIDALKVVKIAKEVNFQVKIVLGGPHPHIYPKETINLPGIDYLILGEGEIAFFELLSHLKKNDSSPPSHIKGLVFKTNGEIVQTGFREPIMNLDELPFPARHLTPCRKYNSILAKKNPVTTMITSRGCPYRCIFCDRPNLGKGFRARGAKNVVDEMVECKKMGINEIFVYDDTFTVDRQRVLDICQEIQERSLNISWDIRARVDTVDLDVLKALKKAGCRRIHYGVEGGTQKILNVLRKGITLEQVEKTFKLTKKLGIKTLGYFMIGSPTETKEDIMKTISFAKKIKADFVQITIIAPLPATDLYKLALEEKVLPNDYMQKFAENPTNDFQLKHWEKELNEKELNNLLSYAYRAFYWRPSYIIKELLGIRSITELKRKLNAGLRILFR